MALDTLPDLTVFATVDDAFSGFATITASVTGNDAPIGETESIGFPADTLTLLSGGDASGTLTDILIGDDTGEKFKTGAGDDLMGVSAHQLDAGDFIFDDMMV